LEAWGEENRLDQSREAGGPFLLEVGGSKVFWKKQVGPGCTLIWEEDGKSGIS